MNMFALLSNQQKRKKKIVRSLTIDIVSELLSDFAFEKVKKKSKVIIRTIDGEIQLLSVYWDNKGNLCMDVGEDLPCP